MASGGDSTSLGVVDKDGNRCLYALAEGHARARWRRLRLFAHCYNKSGGPDRMNETGWLSWRKAIEHGQRKVHSAVDGLYGIYVKVVEMNIDCDPMPNSYILIPECDWGGWERYWHLADPTMDVMFKAETKMEYGW